MLKTIECDKFTETLIVFHKGLNTIVGDDIASNSIGKSNMLMIIDFIFGGSDYIKRNTDTVKNLGEHLFKFSFEFEDETLYFSRDTQSYDNINICDKDYNIIKTIKTEGYLNLLKTKYNITNDDLSFRSILSLYFRIYGRENLNERKPLQLFNKQKESDAITILVKLFKKYQTIKKFDQQLTECKDKLKALKDATKNKFLPSLTKDTFSKNNAKIKELEIELETAKESIIQNSVDIKTLITKEIIQLRDKKSTLVNRKNILEAKLKRTNQNISKQKANLELELKYFTDYFPNFNTDMIEKVDSFHGSLTKILKSELQSNKTILEQQISQLSLQIEKYDKEISDKLEVRDAPQYAVNRIVELVSQIKELQNDNGFYTQKTQLDEKIKTISEDLIELKEKVLAEISSDINSKMVELNNEIYYTERRPPVITLTDKKYSFQTFGDTGTGTACAGLISFDLSILELTDLPALAHDLPLLKNIEDNAVGNIMKLYSQSNKQVFVAIDKVSSFDDETQKIIYNHRVLQLSKDKILFTKNWKNKMEETEND